jgi:hypothetical protein
LSRLEEGLEGVDARIEPRLDGGQQHDVVEKGAFDGEPLAVIPR